MLTIRWIRENGEAVMEAREVQQEWSDNTGRPRVTAYHELGARQYATAMEAGSVYVMNQAGKTIAKYENLHDWTPNPIAQPEAAQPDVKAA